jgi:hypothetical protein
MIFSGSYGKNHFSLFSNNLKEVNQMVTEARKLEILEAALNDLVQERWRGKEGTINPNAINSTFGRFAKLHGFSSDEVLAILKPICVNAYQNLQTERTKEMDAIVAGIASLPLEFPKKR